MNWIGDPYFDQLRVAVGLEEPEGKKGAKGTSAPQDDCLPDIPAGEEELRQIRNSPRPWLLVLVGIVGLAAILWLMVFKPDLTGIGCPFVGTPAEWACLDG